MGIDLYTKKLGWVEARSMYRKGQNVYYVDKAGKMQLMMPYTYMNMWGVWKKERARHAFAYEAQKVRKTEGLKKLTYYKVIEP